MVILETPRLILSEFCMDDLEELYNLIYADPEVKDTWSGVTGTPEEIKNRFAERYIDKDSVFGFKALVIKQTNTLIG